MSDPFNRQELLIRMYQEGYKAGRRSARKEKSVSGLISRQEAYETLSEYYHHSTEIQHKGLREALDRVPSAEPVRMKGEWIYGEKDCQDGWFCSECRFFIPWYYDYYGLNNINFIKDFHLCPHCKAEMVTYTGKKEDTDEHSS